MNLSLGMGMAQVRSTIGNDGTVAIGANNAHSTGEAKNATNAPRIEFPAAASFDSFGRAKMVRAAISGDLDAFYSSVESAFEG